MRLPHANGSGLELEPLVRSKAPKTAMVRAYQPPRPGHNWRARTRTGVLIGGSMLIGAGAAVGIFSVATSALMALGLAGGQVVTQLARQNRLGHDVTGGIADQNLDKALAAGEQALEEAPSGAMRTLAAANLASVLMQQDRIQDGSHVLDLFPPRWPHVPAATILWKNNRAFAHLVLGEDLDSAGALLDDAEQRLEGAGLDGAGGSHNFRKISSALSGTRAMYFLRIGSPKEALGALERSHLMDDNKMPPFRAIERDLCRAEALRRLGRADEALFVVTAMSQLPTTERQRKSLHRLKEKLGMKRFPDAEKREDEWL
jgi:hypothetical protein